MTTESALEQMINKDIKEVLTMDEIKKPEADPTPKGQDLPKGDESNSTKVPGNITPEEHKKGIEDAVAQYGDRIKRETIDPITQERDTFKAQAEQAVKDAKDATATLEETRSHISDLESDIEAFDEDTEDPNKLTKLRKELRDARGKVREEFRDKENALEELRKTTEAERLEWAGTVAEAQAFRFDGELVKLVDECEGDVTVNFTKLKTTCEKAGIKTKEGAEAIAETFLTKKVVDPDLVDDSGVSRGGDTQLSELPIKERMEELNKRVLAKQKV
ncbi:hypothetical protein LCGC14_1140570 [marine sediment metagenome]|uniref:Uncharacterized protein n=1 Tax=marine sediment metagenome TaxID=412755 RepID=A0A0F9Q443_9ZZZZ